MNSVKFWKCDKCAEAFNTENDSYCWSCGKKRDSEQTYEVELG